MRYPYAEQAAHYRQAARDRGCTCPDGLFPHTHLLDCPLYESVGGVPSGFHEHAPAAGASAESGAPRPAPPADARAAGHGETEPGEGPHPASPGAGDDMADVSWRNVSPGIVEWLSTEDGHVYHRGDDGAYHEHLDQEHDADRGQPWL